MDFVHLLPKMKCMNLIRTPAEAETLSDVFCRFVTDYSFSENANGCAHEVQCEFVKNPKYSAFALSLTISEADNMPIKYVGKAIDHRGKRLYEILLKLKNFGVGRMVYRNMFKERLPRTQLFCHHKS